MRILRGLWGIVLGVAMLAWTLLVVLYTWGAHCDDAWLDHA